MAFDGNGTFQLPSPQYPFISSTTILAQEMNEILAEIAAGLSLSFLRDGSLAPTANTKWGGFKITGLGAGTGDGDAVNFGQVFKNPAFIAPSAQASPSAADNSLKLATTEWVRNLAFNSALPGQNAGVAGYFLSTDGTNAVWVSADGRGLRYAAKGNSGAATIALDFLEAECHSLIITGATTLNLTNWPANRVAVRLLQLTNPGLFPPTINGVVWLDPNGAETSDFAQTGVTWQANGRDRIIICSVPGSTPWAKVVR
jgi:hypothetical protein